MGRTHAMAGLAALWLLRAVPGSLTAANLLPVGLSAVVGALAPDLDAAQSLLKSFTFAGIAPFSPWSNLANRYLGHRGLLHSLAFLAVVIGVSVGSTVWLSRPICAGFSLGFASHLLFDAATPGGVPVAGRRTRRVHILPRWAQVCTGSDLEEVVFVVAALAAIALCWIAIGP